MKEIERDIILAEALVSETGVQLAELLLKFIEAEKRGDKETVKKIEEMFDKLKPVLPGLQDFLSSLGKK